MKHLILFDSTCQLCLNSVAFLKKIDKKKKLQYAPLSSGKAKEALGKKYSYLKDENTLVLFENYPAKKKRVWIRGKGAMRILWILGGKWRLLGWLYIFPFIDFFYRIVARHRFMVNK